jgi:hypothetical protein
LFPLSEARSLASGWGILCLTSVFISCRQCKKGSRPYSAPRLYSCARRAVNSHRHWTSVLLLLALLARLALSKACRVPAFCSMSCPFADARRFALRTLFGLPRFCVRKCLLINLWRPPRMKYALIPFLFFSRVSPQSELLESYRCILVFVRRCLLRIPATSKLRWLRFSLFLSYRSLTKDNPPLLVLLVSCLTYMFTVNMDAMYSPETPDSPNCITS